MIVSLGAIFLYFCNLWDEMSALNTKRQKRSDMKAVHLQLALQTVILAIVGTTTGRAADTDPRPPSTPDLQAKIGYCQDCHGSSGQGYLGVVPIPRLAGQTAVYIENQLQAFAEGRRGADIASLLSKTHSLNKTMRTAVAPHFTSLNPKPIGGAPAELSNTGKKIYEEGVPDANLPACSLCHGQSAEGKGTNARLAGQLYAYTVTQLANWGKERTEDASSSMASIAKGMTRPQIEAVAAYLSDVK